MSGRKSGSGHWLRKGLIGLLVIPAAWWLFDRWANQEPKPLPVRTDTGPDPVDEAIDESFPASDPPSWAGR